MQLLRLADVQISPSDRVYSYSRTRAAVVLLIVLGTVAWLSFHAVTAGWKVGYYIAAAVLLFFLLAVRFITARFRSSNWLVRANDQGIFIQFRSYLNYHFPPEDMTVVFLSYGEIRSARMIRERVETLDPQGHGTTTQYLRYVELEIGGDVAPLAKALNAEITEKAPMEKRWYGRSSTEYQDHPVRMPRTPFLQLRWQVVPGAKKFLEALRQYTTIADPVSLTQDFVNLQNLGPEEQLRRLRELNERGEKIAAIYLARKLYGCGLAEAKDMVEQLSLPASDPTPH
jgi:hypothetical protein